MQLNKLYVWIFAFIVLSGLASAAANISRPSSMMIGSVNQERNITTAANSFVITNNGNVALKNLTIKTTAFAKYNITFSLDNAMFKKTLITPSLAVNQSATIYIKGIIPATMAANTNYPAKNTIDIGDITISNSQLTRTISNFYASPAGNLKAENFRLVYEGEEIPVNEGNTKLFNYDGTRNFGIEFDAKNLFPNASDIDINTVKYQVTVKSMNGVDLISSFNDTSIKAGAANEKTRTIVVPEPIDNKTHKVTVKANGKDEFGALHYYTWYAYMRYNVTNQSFVNIINATINKSTLDCTDSATVTVSVGNIGLYAENNAVVTLNSSELNRNKRKDFKLSNYASGTASRKIISIPIAFSDAPAGEYSIDIFAYTKNGTVQTDHVLVDIKVNACDAIGAPGISIVNITANKKYYSLNEPVNITANIVNTLSSSVRLLVSKNAYFANCDYSTQTGCKASSAPSTGTQLKVSTTALGGGRWYARICDSSNNCFGAASAVSRAPGNKDSEEYGPNVFDPTKDFNSSNGDAFIHGIDVNDKLGNYNLVYDLNKDGYNDLITTSTSAEPPYGTSSYTSTGEVYIFYGEPDRFSGSISASTANITIFGYANNLLISQALAAGDLNNDGKTDLVLGTNSADTNGAGGYGGASNMNNGEIYIIYDINSLARRSPYNLSWVANATIWGDAPNPANSQYLVPPCPATTSCGANGTFFGRSAFVEDINNDGIDDLLMPAAFSTYWKNNFREGIVWIMYGDNTSLNGRYSNRAVADAAIIGKNNTYFGFGNDFADFNNDGITDWLVSAYKASPYGQMEAGEVYIVYGPITSTGVHNVTEILDSTFYGQQGMIDTNSGEGIGYFGVDSGDLNGDGYKDIVFGGRSGDPYWPMYNNSGRTYVFYNPKGNWPVNWNVSKANVTFVNPAHNDLTGGWQDVADVNLDGVDDLMIATDQIDNYQENAAGQVLLFYFPWPNGVSLALDPRIGAFYNKTICNGGSTDQCNGTATSILAYYWRINEASLKVYKNNVLLTKGVDYTLDLSDPLHLNSYLSFAAAPAANAAVRTEFTHTWNYEKAHPSYPTAANFTVRGTQSVGDLGMMASYLTDMNGDGTPDLLMDERQFSHNGQTQVGRDVVFYLYEPENGGKVYSGEVRIKP